MSAAAEGYKNKGNDEFKKGNYEKAIEFYTYATEMDPKNHIYYTNRSTCYAQMKKWDKSLRDAEKSLSIKADWEKGHYRKGIALFEMGKFKEAMEALKSAVDINPQNKPAEEKLMEAKKEMMKGMSDAAIIKMEGNEFFQKGNIQEAIKKYSAALAKCGSDEKSLEEKADIYSNRAACYVQLYEPTKVREDCNEALKINPNHSKALLRRGQALEGLEKFKDALADFEQVLRQHSDNKMAMDGASRIRSALKREGKLWEQVIA